MPTAAFDVLSRKMSRDHLLEVELMSGSPAPNSRLPEKSHWLWLRRGDQIFVGTLLASAFVLLSVHWLRLSDWGRQPVEVDRLPARQYQYALEINDATWVEWAQLDGIGETLARRIVADRQTKGPFAGIDDLLRVRGIGPKKLDQMRPFLTIEPELATAARESQ